MSTSTPGQPVSGFPIYFEWQVNEWLPLFDAQVDEIHEDIERARQEDRFVVHLSCPISARGGGFTETNLDVAKFTEHRLANELGDRFWILNPARYQMESLQGTGRVHRHARRLGIPKAVVERLPPPRGGDYMRMWTRVLVEDGADNLGELFDAYYFLGLHDVHRFFLQRGAQSVTAAVERYFAQKHSVDSDFRKAFTLDDSEGDARRKDFVRYYTTRAGATYSSGCHDEWNILVLLNRLRWRRTGIGSQIAALRGGRQVAFNEAEALVSPGYALGASSNSSNSSNSCAS